MKAGVNRALISGLQPSAAPFSTVSAFTYLRQGLQAQGKRVQSPTMAPTPSKSKAAAAAVARPVTAAKAAAAKPTGKVESKAAGKALAEALAESTDEEASASESSGAEGTAAPVAGRRYERKQKTLLLSSRGITTRFRHLFKDLHKLMPHCKKGTTPLTLL